MCISVESTKIMIRAFFSSFLASFRRKIHDGITEYARPVLMLDTFGISFFKAAQNAVRRSVLLKIDF